MYEFETTPTQLFTAALGLTLLAFLPNIFKKTPFWPYIGEKGLLYIHVAAILYFGIGHIILPIAQLASNFLANLANAA